MRKQSRPGLGPGPQPSQRHWEPLSLPPGVGGPIASPQPPSAADPANSTLSPGLPIPAMGSCAPRLSGDLPGLYTQQAKGQPPSLEVRQERGHPQPCLPEVIDFSFQLRVKAEQNKLSPFHHVITVTLSPNCHLPLSQDPHLAKLEGRKGHRDTEAIVLARRGQGRTMLGPGARDKAGQVSQQPREDRCRRKCHVALSH